MSYESKEEQMFNQAVQLSLKSDNENKLKYTIGNLQDLKDKLTYVALPDNWLVQFQTFVKSFASPSTDSNDNRMDLKPFLDVGW